LASGNPCGDVSHRDPELPDATDRLGAMKSPIFPIYEHWHRCTVSESSPCGTMLSGH
jgi:hypothetical protein